MQIKATNERTGDARFPHNYAICFRARTVLDPYYACYVAPRAFGTDISRRKYLERVIKHGEKCRNSKPRRSARCIMYEYHTSQSTARGAKRLFLRWRCHAMKLQQLDLRSRTTIGRSLNSVSPVHPQK